MFYANDASRREYANTNRCWVAVNGPQMCGMLFSEGPALRRHIRNAHSGACKCLLIIR
jgi:hypothetical protein